jgi:hypothetical protein
MPSPRVPQARGAALPGADPSGAQRSRLTPAALRPALRIAVMKATRRIRLTWQRERARSRKLPARGRGWCRRWTGRRRRPAVARRGCSIGGRRACRVTRRRSGGLTVSRWIARRCRRWVAGRIGSVGRARRRSRGLRCRAVARAGQGHQQGVLSIAMKRIRMRRMKSRRPVAEEPGRSDGNDVSSENPSGARSSQGRDSPHSKRSASMGSSCEALRAG